MGCQHQNPAKRRFEVIKRLTNHTLAKYNVLAKFWLLCMTYAAFVLNHTVNLNLAGSTMTPYTMATFQVTDISTILCFHFWEPVYFLLNKKEQHCPSMKKERRGHFVGIAESIGHRMTFLIYTEDTNKVIARLAVRLALHPRLLNLHKEPDHIKEYFNTHHQLDRIDLEMDFKGIIQSTENESKGPHYITEGIANVVYFQTDNKDKHIFCNEEGEPVYPSDNLPAKPPFQNSANSDKAMLDTEASTVFDDNDPVQGTPRYKHWDKLWRTLLNLAPAGTLEQAEAKDRIWKEYEIPLLDNEGKQRFDENGEPMTVVAFDPTNMQGRTFLTKPNEDKEIKRAQVVEMIDEFDENLKQNPQRHDFINDLKYKVVYESPDTRRNLGISDDDVEPDSALKDLLTYNEVCEFLTRDRNSEDGEQWAYREFLNHIHTPLGHKDQKGSEYNMLLLWKNGEQTYKLLSILAKDALVDCAK